MPGYAFNGGLPNQAAVMSWLLAAPASSDMTWQRAVAAVGGWNEQACVFITILL